MKWKKYTIYTTTEAEDIVSLMLNENGVEGVQIENNIPLSEADTKGMFIDILPETAEDDGTSKVSFFLHLAEEGTEAAGQQTQSCADASEDRSYAIADRLWTEREISDLMEAIREGLDEIGAYADLGEGRIEEGAVEDTDWRDNWKQYFRPIRAGSFVIKPTWEALPEDMLSDGGSPLKVIEIDPGTAFGTGSHETTQLCMSAIEKYVRAGDTVLDIGTGSGILGIAALKCGASAVTATELDEMCAPSVRDNLSFNGITENEFRLVLGNVLGDDGVRSRVSAFAGKGYDVVTANILAPVIVLLASPGAADTFCRKGGIFITSGIIDTALDSVLEAFRANPAWKLAGTAAMGEWRSVIAERL